MAYVLGLISADGAIIDARKSSRTCYIVLSSVDKTLIQQVKDAVGSSHKIYKKAPKVQKFKNKSYHCAEAFILRIGSKTMFQDLINLGITPRKSLRLTMPRMTKDCFRFFLRGYFDGDGCVHVSTPKENNKPRIVTIFTSGCSDFLENLSKNISMYTGAIPMKIHFNSGAYRLRSNMATSLKILKFMYSDLNSAPYLDRKYQVYQNYLKTSN